MIHENEHLTTALTQNIFFHFLESNFISVAIIEHNSDESLITRIKVSVCGKKEHGTIIILRLVINASTTWTFEKGQQKDVLVSSSFNAFADTTYYAVCFIDSTLDMNHSDTWEKKLWLIQDCVLFIHVALIFRSVRGSDWSVYIFSSSLQRVPGVITTTLALIHTKTFLIRSI